MRGRATALCVLPSTIALLTCAAFGAGCIAAEPSSDDEPIGVTRAAVESSAPLGARCRVVRNQAARSGIRQAWLIAGIGFHETGLAQCHRELPWSCAGPYSSDCGGPVTAGSGDGPCYLRQGGLGMFQFDAGDYDDTLAREGRRILSVRGNAAAAVEFVIRMVRRSPYISGVHSNRDAIRWINGVRADNPRFHRWIKTVVTGYNGCQPGWSCYPGRYAAYRKATLAIFRRCGGASFWKPCRSHCDGNVVVHRNCARTRCGSVKRCITADRRARCIDPECPADGSRATLCASDGRLLLCDDRNGPRLTCGGEGACTDGRCALETCLGHDGRTCLDGWTMGECADGKLVSGSPCPGGCVEDEAGTHCEPLPCHDVEGSVCLDERTRGECAEGRLVATGPCEERCEGADGEARCASEREPTPDAGGGPTDDAGTAERARDAGVGPTPAGNGGCSLGRRRRRTNTIGAFMAVIAATLVRRRATNRSRT